LTWRRPSESKGINPVRTFRVLMAASAVALAAVACGGDATTTAGSGSAAPAATSASASAPAAGGVAGLPATEILARAKTAFTQASSVHVTGRGSSGSATFSVDMRYGADGKAIGKVDNSGQTVEIRRVGQVLYVKASPAFWTAAAGAKAASLFGGKFVKAPLSDKRLASVVSLTDKASFIDSALATSAGVTKSGAKTVNGTPAIGLTIKDSAGGSTLYVATTGQPVPIEAAPDAGGTDSGKIDFLDYGAPVDVPVPAAGQTVDVSTLPAN
jgi:hypothetical protein